MSDNPVGWSSSSTSPQAGQDAARTQADTVELTVRTAGAVRRAPRVLRAWMTDTEICVRDDAGMLLWLATDAQTAWVHDGLLIAAPTRDDDDEEGLLREPAPEVAALRSLRAATSWLGADPEPIPAAEGARAVRQRCRRVRPLTPDGQESAGRAGYPDGHHPARQRHQPRVRRPAGRGDLNRGATPRRRSIPGAASSLTDGLATSEDEMDPNPNAIRLGIAVLAQPSAFRLVGWVQPL